jgi:hypothetical protein
VSNPKRIAEILPAILEGARRTPLEIAATRVFAKALGRTLACHCRIISIRRGNMIVEVDSAPLMAELTSFHQEQLRRACNRVLEKHLIARIVFRIDGTAHV